MPRRVLTCTYTCSNRHTLSLPLSNKCKRHFFKKRNVLACTYTCSNTHTLSLPLFNKCKRHFKKNNLKKKGHAKIVRLLLDAKADANVQDSRQRTAEQRCQSAGEGFSSTCQQSYCQQSNYQQSNGQQSQLPAVEKCQQFLNCWQFD